MRRFICAAVLVIATTPAVGAQQDVVDDGSYRMQLSAGVGRFTGDYGQEEKTTLDVLSLNARWYLRRAELQISVPYLSVVGGAGVTWIDGQPVAVAEGSVPGDRRKSGWGDVSLRGEYYLRTGSSSSPWVLGLLRVKLPTGNEARGLGSGATDVEAGFGLIQQQGSIYWLADAGYTFVGSAGSRDARNEVRLGAGASLAFGAGNRNSSYIYLENRTSRFGSKDRRSIAVGASTSLTEARRLRLSASVFFGLSESTEDVGVYLTVGRRY